MSKSNILPFNYNGHNLSTITDEQGEVWFIAKDVCQVLDHSNVSAALANLDDDERSKFKLGRQGEVNVINESGLYSLIINSRKPEAKPFKKWVTGEVLPAIRKTGKYEAKVTAKQPSAVVSQTRAHLMVVSMMQKIGVRKEMAMAVALQAIHEDTGLTTEPYRLALPSVEEPANLNQTQLGELLGMKARAVGDLLRESGLMVKDESGSRVITELGRKYGEMKPFNRNGHSGYEPRWNKAVLELLRSTSDIA